MTNQEIAVEIVKLALNDNGINWNNVRHSINSGYIWITYIYNDRKDKMQYVYKHKGDMIQVKQIIGDEQFTYPIHNITKVIELFRSMNNEQEI